MNIKGPIADYADLELSEIYPMLRISRVIAEIDREISHGEIVYVSLLNEGVHDGAATFIATLLYPESPNERKKFIKAVKAKILKGITEPRSKERRIYRDEFDCGYLLDFPNRRINQILSKAATRFHVRNRAAWVMVNKLSSSSNPRTQVTLQSLCEKAAAQCSRHYPPFGDVENNPELAADSFRHRVMNSSRDVSHLAMAMYLYAEFQEKKVIGIPALIQTGDIWLKPVVIAGEMIRMSFGDWFPSQKTQYESRLTTESNCKRVNNFHLPLDQSISVLPYIG